MPGSETSEKSSSDFSAKGSKSTSNSQNNNNKQNSVVCTEVFDENSSPTEDGKHSGKYAKYCCYLLS